MVSTRRTVDVMTAHITRHHHRRRHRRPAVSLFLNAAASSRRSSKPIPSLPPSAAAPDRARTACASCRPLASPIGSRQRARRRASSPSATSRPGHRPGQPPPIGIGCHHPACSVPADPARGDDPPWRADRVQEAVERGSKSGADTIVAHFDDGSASRRRRAAGRRRRHSRVRGLILPAHERPRYTGMLGVGGFADRRPRRQAIRARHVS